METTAELEYEYQEDLERENARAAELIRSRRRAKIFAEASVREVAERVAVQLQESIAAGNNTTVLGVLLILAITKDAIDYADVLIFSIFITKAVALFISLVLIIMMSSGPLGRRMAKMKARLILYVFSFFLDLIPILGFLPVTTVVVLLYWKDIKDQAIQDQEILDNLPSRTEGELNEIEEAFST